MRAHHGRLPAVSATIGSLLLALLPASSANAFTQSMGMVGANGMPGDGPHRIDFEGESPTLVAGFDWPAAGGLKETTTGNAVTLVGATLVASDPYDHVSTAIRSIRTAGSGHYAAVPIGNLGSLSAVTVSAFVKRSSAPGYTQYVA
jgi:hypothetical protein